MEMTVPHAVKTAEPTQAALVVTPHPLTLQGQRVMGELAAPLLPGDTLAAFVARAGVLPGQQWVVSIGGVVVPEAHWSRVRPKHGHLVECRRVPEKSVLRIVAFAALSYFTFGAGSVFGINAAAALGSTGLAIAKGALYLAGSLVINKLLGPKAVKAPDNTVSPTYSLSAGGRNQARLFQPMALVLGEPYAVPDLAAQPYTFFRDGEQYLWQMFHLGINCADAQALRIGQTALETYAGVTVLRDGLASGNSPLPALGTSVDTVAGGALTAPGGSGAWVQRTSSAGTVRLAADLVASIFSVNSGGAYVSRTAEIAVEYRAIGAPDWIPLTPAVAAVPPVTIEVPEPEIGGTYTQVITPGVPGRAAGTVQLTSASQKPLRQTLETAVPSGQYEVRLRKLSADETGTNGANQIEWTALRSYQADTASYDSQARLAIQIQSSGQLNGSLDEINAALRAKPMPLWNGTAWVSATDRASGLCNPGAIFLLLCRGIYNTAGRRLAGLGYSDDRIDIAGLQRFMVRCTEQGFQFDLFLQESTSINDLLDAVAYAGMGELTWPDGRIGVTYFTESDPIEGVINMGNIKARSFAVTYDTLPTADEIEFQYVDRDRGNTWKSVRVLAPGVSNPRSTARQPLVGITSEAQAATLARFSMAQNIYQRKTVELEMDLEYMTHRRGAVVSLSHDMTQWGFGGRLMACELVGSTVRLTLDDTAPGTNPLGGASAPYIGLRLPGEAQMRVFPVVVFAGEGRVVELDAPWPAGVPLPGSSDDNPAHDTLWVYDFKAVPGQRLRVVGIEPGAQGTARLTLVPELAEFWTYTFTGAYTPPPNESLLRAAPAVDRVRVSEELARQGNTFYTELTISYETAGNFRRAELWGAVGGGEISPPQRLLAQGQSQALNWRGGLEERWHLELRVYGDTRAGEPYRLYYDVVGLSAPPPPFDEFTVLAQPDGTRQYNFSYTTTPRPIDWEGAEIRYAPGPQASPDWDAMLPLQDDSTHYTASPVETNAPLAGTWVFACRSRDTSGNTSTLRVVNIELGQRRSGSAYAEVSNDPTWPGTRTNFVLIDGVLEAQSADTWDTLPTTWDAWTLWASNPAASASYIAPALDLESQVAGQVDVTLDALGSPTLELRTGADGVNWSAWGPAANTFTARWVQLRVTLAATGPEPVVTLRSLSYVVAADLQREYINDVSPAALAGAYRIGTGDVRAPLTRSYTVLRRATAVIQDSSAGTWTWVRLDKNTATGPRFQFRLNGSLADPALVDFDIEGI